jgi:polar amino acid transport system permease protein
MTGTKTERARSEPIKAVPVRHPWRWVGAVVIIVLAAMFIHMLITNDHFQWHFIFVSSGPGQRGAMFTPAVLAGLRGTLLLTVLSMLIGVTLGIVIAVMRLSPSPILKWAAFGYVWFFRAIPRLVLAVLFGNLGILWPRIGVGLPFDAQIGGLFGVHDLSAKIYGVKAVDLLSGFIAGMLALALSEAAYMAEIVRAGIQSIDPGQAEAASALGLSRDQTLRRVVLPQAMRVIVPPTGNETIAMVKDTSLVAFTPVSMELFFQLQAIGSRTFQVFPVLVAAVLWYLIICTVLMVIQYYVERHYSRGYGQARRVRSRVRGIEAEHGGGITIAPAGDEGSGGAT